MKTCRRTSFAFAILAAVTFGSSADAKDKRAPGLGALDAANALAKKGDALGAASKLGEIIASAQSGVDLGTEDAAAAALDALVEAAPQDATANTTIAKDGTSRSALLAAVMAKLDRNRSSGFVSAPCLARSILQSATRTGVMTDVPAAAAVLAAHATKPTSGRAAATVAKYAAGMSALVDGKPDVAAVALVSAADEAAKSGWWDLAACAATEAAVAWTKAGSAEKALAVVTATAAATGDGCRSHHATEWRETLAGRLPQSTALLAPIDALLARTTAVKPPEHDGGEGGQGGDGLAGDAAGTDFALFHAKLGKGKPIATARRVENGFEIHWAMKPALRPTSPVTYGVHFVYESGVWLGCRWRSVGLEALDVLGSHDGPAAHWSPSPARATYLLADGETWTLLREGVVTISK